MSYRVCEEWGSTQFKWKDAYWTWEECRLVEEIISICQKWGSTQFKWKDAKWKWSECRLVEEIITSVISVGPGGSLARPWEQWEEPKKRRFIYLTCKIKGKEYDRTKEVKDIKISVDDVRLVVKAVAGTELNIKEVRYGIQTIH